MYFLTLCLSSSTRSFQHPFVPEYVTSGAQTYVLRHSTTFSNTLLPEIYVSPICCLTTTVRRGSHTSALMSLTPQTAPAHSQASLPSLPAHLQSDTHITAHLASRFHVSLPTAQLSSHALISLNTYTSAIKGPNGGKEGSAANGAEDLAERAFARLGARSENQSITFL